MYVTQLPSSNINFTECSDAYGARRWQHYIKYIKIIFSHTKYIILVSQYLISQAYSLI